MRGIAYGLTFLIPWLGGGIAAKHNENWFIGIGCGIVAGVLHAFFSVAANDLRVR